MNKIYEVSGALNKGFVGQISYTVCLDRTYGEMDICFSFDKQHYQVITEELKQDLITVCRNEYEDEYADMTAKVTDEDYCKIIKEMKTEIHTIATMNDIFIGGIHKQLTTRHMYFSSGSASEGCIPQPSVHGVIKITLVVFNVILDDTHYTLSLHVK